MLVRERIPDPAAIRVVGEHSSSTDLAEQTQFGSRLILAERTQFDTR
jgi:hypothetical protein